MNSHVVSLPTPELLSRLEELKARRAKLAELEALAEQKRTEADKRAVRVRRELLRPYRDDPALFLRECFLWPEGKGPAAYQEKALSALPTSKRVAIRGPHGLGKTALNAWTVLWFASTREGEDWKVITTASSWRQLEVYLWPEIHKWSRMLDWSKLGREPFTANELLMLNLKLFTGAASAVASDRPELIEGAHADQILYIFDEAKVIPDATFDAAEGAFSGAGGDGELQALALACSTPGEPQGRFYDIHRRKAGFEDWEVFHVTVDEAIAAGRVSTEWVEQRAKQWGRKSAVFINRVLGDFASSDEDSVIPLAWVEAAIARWELGEDAGPLTCVGVDVARSGSDKTTLAPRYGWRISEVEAHSLEDLMQTTGRVVGALQRGGYAVVDVIGIGAGVVDRLREQGLPVIAFNAGAGTHKLDASGELAFLNCRSAAWWTMREVLDPTSGCPVALPPDDLLIGDLTAPKWRVTSAGKIQVESKDEIRKRLGRSTDHGDAVIESFWVPEAEPTEELLVYDDHVSISRY